MKIFFLANDDEELWPGGSEEDEYEFRANKCGEQRMGAVNTSRPYMSRVMLQLQQLQDDTDQLIFLCEFTWLQTGRTHQAFNRYAHGNTVTFIPPNLGLTNTSERYEEKKLGHIDDGFSRILFRRCFSAEW